MMKTALSMLSFSDEVTVKRYGKKVTVVGRDGTNVDSDSVEANLLFDILKELRKKK